MPYYLKDMYKILSIWYLAGAHVYILHNAIYRSIDAAIGCIETSFYYSKAILNFANFLFDILTISICFTAKASFTLKFYLNME